MSRKNRVKKPEWKDDKKDTAALPHPLHGKQQNLRKARVRINKILSNQARLQTALKAETLKDQRAGR